jgi:PAS domain S-box-containing protein
VVTGNIIEIVREGSGSLEKAARQLHEANAQLKVFWEQGLFAARLDTDGAVVDANRAWVEGCGFAREEILGRKFWDCGWWNAKVEVQQWVRHAVEQGVAGVPFRGESPYWISNGSERVMELACAPLENISGRVSFVLVTGRDLNGRARASALLSAIVDSSDDAIISKNLDGIIMSWNKSAERLFGYTAREAIGRSIMLIIPPERAEEEPQILEKLKRGERVDHFETVRVHKDGTRLNISLTISPVKDSSGRIVGASKVARDITERVRHAQAMEEAHATLKRANADLEQFAYSASHDLQEPLRMVASYSELLQRKFAGQLGPEADRYIEYMVQGALRMETLLRDLRLYTQVSTMDAGAREEIDASEVLKKTLANLDVAIRNAGASISSTDLPKVRMHEFQLAQLFQNLVGNAIRYRSQARPEIRVAAARAGDYWQFSVQDNGIGIEPRFKEQVFGIFKRLHSTAEYPGTGMGLAICQRIVERIGGRIWLESEPGRGSTFYFTVPGA